MKKLLFAFIMLVLILFSAHAYAQNPSESQMKKDIQAAIDESDIFIGPKYSHTQPRKEYLGSLSTVYQLVECKKTDGQSSERNGVKYYVMEINGKVKVTKDIYIDEWNNFRTYSDPKNSMNKTVGKIQAGEIIPFSGKMYYERTEKGWRLLRREIKMIKKAPGFHKIP